MDSLETQQRYYEKYQQEHFEGAIDEGDEGDEGDEEEGANGNENEVSLND